MISTGSQRAFGLALVCMFAFSGCGGGGGGRGGALAPPDRNGIRDLTRLQVSEVSPQAARAAQNTPNEGSIAQSSSGDGGVSPATTDAVEVDVVRDGSEYTFTVTKTGAGANLNWEVTENDLQDVYGNDEVIDDSSGLEASRRLDTDGDDTNDGTLWVDFYTDIESASDTDWLAGGIWLYVPDEVSRVSDIEIGAFVDGNDPFTAANIDGLTGTATYTGGATGLYTNLFGTPEDDGTPGEGGYFEADVRLDANFGTNTAPGSISGTVSDIVLNDEDYDGQLRLETATITDNDDGGFFTGVVSASGAPANFEGRWGGQFFGNDGDDATAHPATVGGTFGATATNDVNDEITFIGAFGARLD